MKKIRYITSGLAFRVIAAIILLLIGFGCITSIIGYMRFTKSLTEEYNDSAFRTAETAAAFINPDHIESYLETSGAGEEYSTTLARLDMLCQKQNVTLLYAIAVDTTDYQSFRSVFNLVNESSGYTPWEIGYERETTNEEYRSIYQDIYENLYTDGVAEATNSAQELFGMERMLKALNTEPDARPEVILKNMNDAVNAFVGDAPQFDDLTMLAVKLNR